MLQGQRFLFISHVCPVPAAAGNEIRILNLIQWLKQNGAEIHFIYRPLEEQSRTVSTEEMKMYGIDYWNPISASTEIQFRDQIWARLRIFFERFLVTSKLREIQELFCPAQFLAYTKSYVRRKKPDVIICEYIFMSRSLWSASPGTFRCIDLHDLFQTKTEKVLRFGFEDSLALTANEELSLINRADVSFAIQMEETNLLKEQKPRSKVISVGYPIQVHATQKSEKDSIIIVGSSNPFNIRGTQEFVRYSWPQIHKKFPKLKLRILGKVGKSIEETEGVEICGFVSDLKAFYEKAFLAVNPAYAGTGLKIKSVEALSFSCPLVTFPAGVDGFPPVSAQEAPFVISRNFIEMAAEIVELLSSPNLNKSLRANIESYCLKHFSTETCYGELKETLQLRQCNTKGVLP